MKETIQKTLRIAVALILCILFGAVLSIYMSPMEDVTLDLSLIDKSSEITVAVPDEKGWEVYTQEGDTVTHLEHNGYGSYLGIELGQTLYLSRVMTENLDSPTLQLGAGERTFSVWLDDTLIYTDCPELDNRIGHLRLPMNSTYRSEPVIINLPINYVGKTLTIAHSTPPYSETPTLKATPASVVLYCGYAYESGIIAESYTLAISATALFAAGLLLLILFTQRRDWSLLCIALAAFMGMCTVLSQPSFMYNYFGVPFSLHWYTRWFAALALMLFLALKAEHCQRLFIGMAIAGFLYTPVSAVFFFFYRSSIQLWPKLLFNTVPEVLFLLTITASLVLGVKYRHEENRFRRVYTPITVAALVLYLAVMLARPETRVSLAVGLTSGSTYQLYLGFLNISSVTALIATLWDALKSTLEYRTEKHLMEQRRQLILSSYDSLRRQHEEVMMLRHDMRKHFHALRSMSPEGPVSTYLDDLIGQTEKISSVAHTGNDMLDIILNGKIKTAADAGVKIELLRAGAPEKLPLPDTDLCSLVMNILDNAITAAAASGAEEPYIHLDVHTKNNHVVFVSQNSASIHHMESLQKNETVPKHGLGLKIIQSIVSRHNCLLNTEYGKDYYKIQVAIPMFRED